MFLLLASETKAQTSALALPLYDAPQDKRLYATRDASTGESTASDSLLWWNELSDAEKWAIIIFGGLGVLLTAGGLGYAIATKGIVVSYGTTVFAAGAAASIVKTKRP